MYKTVAAGQKRPLVSQSPEDRIALTQLDSEKGDDVSIRQHKEYWMLRGAFRFSLAYSGIDKSNISQLGTTYAIQSAMATAQPKLLKYGIPADKIVMLYAIYKNGFTGLANLLISEKTSIYINKKIDSLQLSTRVSGWLKALSTALLDELSIMVSDQISDTIKNDSGYWKQKMVDVAWWVGFGSSGTAIVSKIGSYILFGANIENMPLATEAENDKSLHLPGRKCVAQDIMFNGKGISGKRALDNVVDAINLYNLENSEKCIQIKEADGQIKLILSDAGSVKELNSLICTYPFYGWFPQVDDQSNTLTFNHKSECTGVPSRKYPQLSIEHSDYGSVRLDPEHQKNFLSKFKRNTIDTKTQDPTDLCAQLKPMDRTVRFDCEQVLLGKEIAVDRQIEAINTNADLGLMHTLSKFLRGNGVTSYEDGHEIPTFTILSHGHAIAGLAEMSGWKTEGGYLFDTTVLMPMGGWSNKGSRLGVATNGAQLWGDLIARNKQLFQSNGELSIGGLAVGLNGHRGDLDYKTMKAANINLESYFGTPSSFAEVLKKRGLRTIAVVTEHYVRDPDIVNEIPLSELKNSSECTFNRANKDLFDYLFSLKKLGFVVRLFSGEQRTNRLHAV